MYKRTLSPIMEKHGYTGALWCAFFSIRMFHDPDPNDPQPNQPFYKLWHMGRWLKASLRASHSGHEPATMARPAAPKHPASQTLASMCFQGWPQRPQQLAANSHSLLFL